MSLSEWLSGTSSWSSSACADSTAASVHFAGIHRVPVSGTLQNLYNIFASNPLTTFITILHAMMIDTTANRIPNPSLTNTSNHLCIVSTKSVNHWLEGLIPYWIFLMCSFRKVMNLWIDSLWSKRFKQYIPLNFSKWLLQTMTPYLWNMILLDRSQLVLLVAYNRLPVFLKSAVTNLGLLRPPFSYDFCQHQFPMLSACTMAKACSHSHSTQHNRTHRAQSHTQRPLAHLNLSHTTISFTRI